jgi:spore coat protein U-like protein
MNSVIRCALATVAAPFALVPSAAMAGTTSSPLSVTATVTANCTVSATAPVAFGNVNTISGSNVDATGAISVTCTNGTTWSAGASIGTGTGATFASRKMTAGSNLLNYSLYTDTGRTTIWGDGSTGNSIIAGTGSGTAQAVTIYGRIGAGQTSAPAGAYSDTVSVTVTY